ncbi:unnamed protein product, partial [Amoebophrya sp. A25]|eukprot:GSA25T00001406001.1
MSSSSHSKKVPRQERFSGSDMDDGHFCSATSGASA